MFLHCKCIYIIHNIRDSLSRSLFYILYPPRNHIQGPKDPLSYTIFVGLILFGCYIFTFLYGKKDYPKCRPFSHPVSGPFSGTMQAIEGISEQASREWSIEKALEKMRADWQGLNFELAEWKSTGTHILRGGPLDESQTLLDDHIIKSRAMSVSPFAKPFAAEIAPWVTRLTRLSAILEQWLTCQVQPSHRNAAHIGCCCLL